MMSTLLQEVEELVARVGTHPVWGYTHCLRVCALAEELAEAERLDYNREILRFASLLHDIGLYKAYKLRDAPDHAERSAMVARRILNDGDFPSRATRVIVDAIRHHPPGAQPAHSTESALLKDAIALDYLGAIGISRILAMVGVEEDVPDVATAVRQAEALRQRLPGFLVFPSSEMIARDRVLEMDGFLDSLRHESANLKLL